MTRSSLAAQHPLNVRERVTRMLSMFHAWLRDLGAVERRAAEINGQLGMLFFDAESRAVVVITLDIAGGQVTAVRSVTNPEKLGHCTAVLPRCTRTEEK